MRRQAAGFSLLELTLFILVLGVVLTLGLRRGFDNKPTDQFPNLLAELNNLALFAQTEAIASGAEVAMSFSALPAGGFSVRVMRGVDNADLASDYLLKTNFETSSVFALEKLVVAEQVVQAGAEQRCLFFPSGFCQGCTLLVSRDDLDQRTEAHFELMPFFARFERISNFSQEENVL